MFFSGIFLPDTLDSVMVEDVDKGEDDVVGVGVGVDE